MTFDLTTIQENKDMNSITAVKQILTIICMNLKTALLEPPPRSSVQLIMSWSWPCSHHNQECIWESPDTWPTELWDNKCIPFKDVKVEKLMHPRSLNHETVIPAEDAFQGLYHMPAGSKLSALCSSLLCFIIYTHTHVNLCLLLDLKEVLYDFSLMHQCCQTYSSHCSITEDTLVYHWLK